MTPRLDGRACHEARSISVVKHFTKYAAGSVLISCGDTRVLCTASIEEKVPHFLKDSGQGWLTAEYSLLPSSTLTRVPREINKGKPTGRTSEIQRIIGRSLRAAVDLKRLGERTIHIDCDVLQADGGTRTTSVTGAMIALSDAIQSLIVNGDLRQTPIVGIVSAISVGIVNGDVMCDLNYSEDSRADVDMNVVMLNAETFVEIQGTAENRPYTRAQLDGMLGVAQDALTTTNAIIQPLLSI
ncbi:ribonuclease PH [bacterium]|nr:ribonuclease PH [bacterium]